MITPNPSLSTTLTPDEVSCPDERELSIIVNADGSICFLHDDDTAEFVQDLFGPVTTRRASHIEPTGDGRWYVDVGPITGTDATVIVAELSRHDAAKAFEQAWVTARLRGDNANHPA